MKLAVVIPLYNSAATIAATLEATLAVEPNGHDVEIVVVDDGSTDESRAVAARYPVAVIPQANTGPAGARNTGWRRSDGEIILFTDADCRPEPDWIGQMLPPFEQEYVGAVAGSYSIANPGRALARLIQAEIRHRHRVMGEFVKAGGSYNLAVRRSVLEQVGGFDESYPTASGEDNDLSYRIQKAGYRIAFNPNSRVAHVHPERFWKYLKIQFVHGYWRGLLYRRHPEFVTGDDYTRPRDILGSFLATAFLGLCPLVLLAPRLMVWPLAALLAALVGMEGLCALEIAIRNGDGILFPLGTITFSVRSFFRVTGWFRGLLAATARRETAGAGVRR
ncbi:MAG: glycosyltransferase [Acidobacteria bacterium]|nr:glycosyltransferase [Acidobacteriota bacterium]